jgi:hypothetical protein
MDPVKRRKVLAGPVARRVLLDWRGIKDGGTDVPYSVELATKWLREIAEFFALVEDHAGELDAFLVDQTEADAAALGNG